MTASDRYKEDLELARACSAGDAAAVAVCKERFERELRKSLSKMRLADAVQDDVVQQTWARVFVGGGKTGEALIVGYEGRGPLGGWLRVVAVRIALKRLRADKRLFPVGGASTVGGRVGAALGGPEAEHFRFLYGDAFRKAFRAAMRSLSPSDRELLKEHIVEGKSIDDIAERLDVHRATAARKLVRAKRALMVEVRLQVMARLEISGDTYESLAKMIRSQIEFSVQAFSRE